MTVAYCIAAHTRPSQCARLVRRLLNDDPDCRVLLHYDQRQSPPLDLRQVSAPQVRLFRARPIYWGGPQLADLYVEMFRLSMKEGCSYAVMLTGQDYPLGHVAGLEAKLSAYDVWDESRPLFSSDGSCNSLEGRRRYTYRWWHLNSPPKLLRGAERVAGKVLRVPMATSQPSVPYLVRTRQYDQVWWGVRSRGPGVPVHSGSVFMDLSRRAIEVILSCPKRLSSFFHHVPCSDEAWFHTTLRNATGLTFALGNSRYMHWIEGEAHPELLTSSDLDDMVASGARFGRKFDEVVDSSVLDRLDALAGSPRRHDSQGFQRH